MKMQVNKRWSSPLIMTSILLIFSSAVNAQGKTTGPGSWSLFIFLLIFLLIVLGITLSMSFKTKEMIRENKRQKGHDTDEELSGYLQNLDSSQIETILKKKNHASETSNTQKPSGGAKDKGLLLLISLFTDTIIFCHYNYDQHG
jgi:hypothetical protein